MFRNPLSEKDAINNRSAIIDHFSRLKMSFPFEAALFDMAEKYLLSDEQKKNTVQQTTLSEKDVSNGVLAVIGLIQRVREFIERQEVMAITSWGEERAVIATLLADPAFDPVYREKAISKLSYGAITAYDLLFRVRERNKIEMLLTYIYRLDVYLSVAKVAVDRNFIFPKALDKGSAALTFQGVYHPEVSNPVSNNVTLGTARNVIFLTGANMAGKSTFLRALSTAVYVAHMGFPVAARSMEFSVMDGVYTTINLPDNLGIGASHFYAEVLRVKKIASELHAGKCIFVVFDELFRGTNVKDAHEATVEISLAFARKKKSLFIISSHIVEAGEQLQKEPAIEFQYLPTRMNGHVPEYTYTLETGITADRHGMIIIQNEGILDILRKGKKRDLLTTNRIS
jgi:hypothetical protein